MVNRFSVGARIHLREADEPDDPAELRMRIAALEKAVADLHEAGAGPATSLKTMISLDQRTTLILKVLRRVAKGLGDNDPSDA